MKTIVSILCSSVFLLACGPKKISESTTTKTSTPSSETEAVAKKNTETPPLTISGSLEKSVIDQGVKEAMPAIRNCYVQEVEKRPELSGKLKMKFVIGNDGSVQSVKYKADESSFDDPVVIECVSQEMMKMTFPVPKGGGIVIASHRFVFDSME